MNDVVAYGGIIAATDRTLKISKKKFSALASEMGRSLSKRGGSRRFAY